MLGHQALSACRPVPLKPLEMAAVQVGETVARVPDLAALENLLHSAL